AGDAQDVYINELVELDGSASYDADGDYLTYRWSLTNKPQDSDVTLTATDTAWPQFTPDKVGTYIAQLIVNDGEFDSDPSQVAIRAGLPACDISDATRRTLPITL